MDSYNYLLQKLESFIRRYYINELIRGAILFLSMGLLYFLLTLLVEYFLWLDSFGRQVLFWSFILVEVLLLFRFLVIPLLKLFKLSKGLDYGMASRIIGEHFPEVKDKLLNVLQLRQESRQTELLLAGIEQKALELKLFEDRKDSIKLTSLVSNVVDKETQEKIDVVKSRLMKNYGYCDVCATDVLNYVASIFARGDAKE